jgi:hypothetical protein
MKVSSRKVLIQASDQKIYFLLNNFNNFGRVLPEQIQHWESTAEWCKFTIQGLLTMTLSILEKHEFSKIIYQADNDKNIHVTIVIDIIGENEKSDILIEANVDVPVFLSAMLNKPLQNFVDLMAEKIKIEAEKRVI